jgi:preprotein translocase subunit YajC
MEKLILSLLPWIVLFGLMWFLWIRPQQIKDRERQEMLDSLDRGDQIVTIGGIHGTITSLRDDIVQVRIADQVEVKLARSGVGHLAGEGEEE